MNLPDDDAGTVTMESTTPADFRADAQADFQPDSRADTGAGWELTVPVHTERTLLRRHSRHDADDLLVFHSDPAVTRYLPWPVRDLEAVVATLEDKLRQTSLNADGAWLSLAVEERDTNRVIGEALLSRTSSDDGTAEVGYALARDMHRHGLGSEIVTALLESAWRQLPVNRVLAHVEADNVPSRRLLEKLGFREHGRKGDDCESTLVRYVIDRPAGATTRPTRVVRV